MKILYNKIFLQHETGSHPENKKRLLVVNAKESEIENGEKYLTLVHDKKYVKYIKEICDRQGSLDFETVTSKDSYKAATYAVGATIMASEKNDFALVRPPGHHAYPNKASGFCIFNNMAIAVQKLVKEGKKVLILDIDGHLGDGTEYYFYDSDKVLYWSLHQYPEFPGSGWVDEIGNGKGKGFTINMPLPAGTGDDLYLDAIKRFIWIAKKFQPDVVGVSAGFDGHKDDLLLNLQLSINSYYEIGKVLRKNFNKIFATLEGGYNLQILAKCINNFIDGINGEEQKFKEANTKTNIKVKKEYNNRIKLLEKNLLKCWKK
jgi:acetoin utilization deacetylase AcuC-like enzyme